MTLLDAYALVAFIADEPAAAEVEVLLRAGDCGVVVANLAEAIDVCTRVHGLGAGAIRDALDPLLGEPLAVVVSTDAEAWQAAALRATHYDRRRAPVSLADCLLLAHATLGADAIATADALLANAARAEGVDVASLPGSSGARP